MIYMSGVWTTAVLDGWKLKEFFGRLCAFQMKQTNKSMKFVMGGCLEITVFIINPQPLIEKIRQTNDSTAV